MIFATVIVCIAMATPACSEKTGYKAVRIEQRFKSTTECQATMMRMAPSIPINDGDTVRIVCGGRYARIIGADI